MTNPRHVLPVAVDGGKNAEQLHASPSGSGTSVWEMPAIVPMVFFRGHAMLLLGPPRVPRSNLRPSSHAVAWRVLLPGRLEYPATSPMSLMLLPRLLVPPSDDR